MRSWLKSFSAVAVAAGIAIGVPAPAALAQTKCEDPKVQEQVRAIRA